MFPFLFRYYNLKNNNLHNHPFRTFRRLHFVAPPLLLLLFVGINSLVLSGVTGCSASGLLSR